MIPGTAFVRQVLREFIIPFITTIQGIHSWFIMLLVYASGYLVLIQNGGAAMLKIYWDVQRHSGMAQAWRDMGQED